MIRRRLCGGHVLGFRIQSDDQFLTIGLWLLSLALCRKVLRSREVMPIPKNFVRVTEFSEWNEYDPVRIPGIGGTSSILLDVTEMDGICMRE